MRKVGISVYKYNKQIHYEWQTFLIKAETDYVLVAGNTDRKLIHHTKNRIFNCPNRSIEFFSLSEGFTVNIDIEESGKTEYYCNICLPAEFDSFKDNVSFIDLDLDLLIDSNGNRKVVDEDEFISNSVTMNYSKATIDFARDSLSKLEEKILRKEFPFDGFLDYHIENSL